MRQLINSSGTLLIVSSGGNFIFPDFRAS